MRATLLLGAVLLLGSCGDEPAPARPSRVLPSDLASADVSTRIAAARALRGGGAEAEQSVAALAAALRDRHELVRQAAAQALRDLGPRAAPALPALRAAFVDEDVYVRWHVAEALGRIGAAAVEDLPALEARGADEDESEIVRAASVRAAERIRGK